MKIGCVIQGDIRRGTNYVINHLQNKFDLVILSTWEECKDNLPKGDFITLLNKKPSVGGLSNRNYQRLTTAKGIKAAKDAGCEYVLKCRTDMLLSRLDLITFIDWANSDYPSDARSRLVMPAFRNLSVQPDWFSSIPDIFSFGRLEEMELLWGDDGFNYSADLNFPEQMRGELDDLRFQGKLSDIYCPESELYAIYKSRLQIRAGKNLSHRTIAKNYLRLIDHQKLGIFWFSNSGGFRSVGQAWEHPWWTEGMWKNGKAVTVPIGFGISYFPGNLRRLASKVKVLLEKMSQSIRWKYRK
jgi:hypothetical protein